MRPAPFRIQSPTVISDALAFLIRRGIHGASLQFQFETNPAETVLRRPPSRAVVFAKYIISHGDVGLRGSCSQDSEPAVRFDALRQELKRRGIPHSITIRNGERTVDVQCGRDLGLGLMFVTLAFKHFFEARLEEHCVAYFHRIADRDAPSITGVDLVL
jgi:hypothetical protein